MPNFNTLSLVALSFLVFVLGVFQIALENAVLKNYEHYASRGSVSWPEGHVGGPRQTILLTPIYLRTGVTTAVFVSGSLAMVAGLTCAVFTANSANKTVARKLAAFFTFASVATATAAVLIYAFVQEYTSATWRYVNTESSYGSFTRESWACQTGLQYRWPGWEFWGWTCGDAKAARWTLVPLLICLTTISTISYLDLQNQQSPAEEDGVGLEERSKYDAQS